MKQGRGIIIIVVAILVVAAVILVGYAYLETDVFKTPEQKFTKYLLGNYKQFESFNLTPFDEFSERALLESSKVDVNIKQKIDGAGLIPGSTDSVEGVTKVTVMTDPISKKQQTNLNITALNVDFFDLEAFATDTRIALKVPDLHDKYIGIDTIGLQGFATGLGVEEQYVNQIPDTINLFPTDKQLTEEEQKQVQDLAVKYGKRLLELIDDEIFVEENKVSLRIEDQTYETDKYSVTLTTAKITSIYTTITSELFAEPTLDSLFTKYIPNLKIADLKVSNEEIITALNELKQDSSFTLAVYASDGVTRKTEFVTDNGGVNFYIVNDAISSKLVLEMNSSKTELNPVGSTQTIVIKNEVQNQTSNLYMETIIDYNQSDVEALKTETDAEGMSSFYDDKYYKERYAASNAKVNIRTTKTDANTIKSSYSASGKGAEAYEGMDISFIVKLNESLKFSDFTDDNTIVINDYSPTEYALLGMQLMTNASETAQNRPQSFVGVMYNLFTSVFMKSPITDALDTMELNEVKSEIEKAIENILLAYRFASRNSTTENIGDYLTVDNIKSKCSEELQVEFYDGQTLKCTKNDNVYYVSFQINGSTFTLDSIDAKYSPDGTFEGITSEDTSSMNDTNIFSTDDVQDEEDNNATGQQSISSLFPNLMTY